VAGTDGRLNTASMMTPAATRAKSWPFWLFLSTVILSGFAVTALCVAQLADRPTDFFWHDRMPGLIGLTLLIMLTGRFSIKVPGHSARVSISEVFTFLAAFHLGASAW